MSAIYGIINKNGKPVDPEMVQKMKQAMQHRAKDGSKELICDNAAFGFCHLVVYPNQEHEQLPIQDGDLVFTANAHLHNRDELLTKLGFNKLQYSKTPDSYLILEAYKKWGLDCVHHLDGEYVYAIWNRESQELFISNDHIGYKALYYYDTPEQFIFCSEIKGIEAVKTTPNYFDEQSILFFLPKVGLPDATYNREIKFLTASRFIILSGGTLSQHKYWHLSTRGNHKYIKDKDWFDCTRELFIQAISNRFNPNRPVGISLSGGIDSSSVACILSSILKKINKPLYSFSSVVSAKYSREFKDESEYISLLNSHCGNIIQTNITAEESSPFENYEKAFFTDESIPNSFHYMDHAILNAASERGVKTLYSGFGGDFWVSWNVKPSLFALLHEMSAAKLMSMLWQVAQVEQKSFLGLAAREFKNLIANTSLFKKLYGSWQLASYVRQPYKKDFKTEVKRLRDRPKNANLGYYGKYIGVFDTRNEHFGMTNAAPFFDKNLLELMMDMPAKNYIAGGNRRAVIRYAMEGILPKEIQWRRTKSAYVVDHYRRISENMDLIHQILSQCSRNKLFWNYFDRDALLTLSKNATQSTTEKHDLQYLQLRLGLIIVCYLTLEKLDENKFRY